MTQMTFLLPIAMCCSQLFFTFHRLFAQSLLTFHRKIPAMLLLLGAVILLADAYQPVVQTKLGKVQGFQVDTEVGGKADIFLNIPFAEPPVGELRFEVRPVFKK